MIITGNARMISINPRRHATRRARSASFVEASCASRPDAPAWGSGPLGIGKRHGWQHQAVATMTGNKGRQ